MDKIENQRELSLNYFNIPKTPQNRFFNENLITSLKTSLYLCSLALLTITAISIGMAPDESWASGHDPYTEKLKKEIGYRLYPPLLIARTVIFGISAICAIVYFGVMLSGKAPWKQLGYVGLGCFLASIVMTILGFLTTGEFEIFADTGTAKADTFTF